MATAKINKIGLKGFAGVGIFPDVSDTETEYSAAGERISFVGASSGTFTDNREEYEIPGDDGIYDSGSDWTSTDVDVTIHEIDLAALAKLVGCDINEAKKAIEEGTLDIAETVCLVYRALRRDGGYRCYRYYNCKLTKYSVSHNTKSSSNNDGQPYTLTFKCIPRAVDGKIRGTADVANLAEANTWLASVPTVTAE